MTSSVQDSATRNRSNSGEETGLPEHDRKRPRLSEGTSDADQHLPDINSASDQINILPPSTLTSVASPQHSPKPALPPRSPDANMVTPSPTSRVTINTRPISSQSSSNNVTIPTKNEASAADAAEVSQQPPAQVPISNAASASTAETISISSSPAGSPEIEVAEVEDFDQDPTQTRWTTRIGGSGTIRTILPSHVRSSFPYAAEYKVGDARLAVNRIAKMLSDPSRDPGQIFQVVKQWLVDFASSCDMLTEEIVHEEHLFWARLWSLPDALLRRDQRGGTSVDGQDLIEFFVAFGQITKLMFDFETRKSLEISGSDEKTDATFTAMAWAYLTPISCLLTGNCTLLASLQRYHGLDPLLIIQPCCHQLMDLSQLNLMQSITDLITALSGALMKSSKFFKDPSVLTNTLLNLVEMSIAAPELMTTPTSTTYYTMETIRLGLGKALFGLDKLLQDSIKKQCPWLNMDVGADMINKLSPIFLKLGSAVPQFGRDVISAAGVVVQDSDYTYLDPIVGLAWKFSMCYKFLRYGKMELRVCGVERMSNELVSAYSCFIRDKQNGTQEPAVLFLNRFLRENNIIPYVVSVDSHPQILQRSANLVGFLSVSHTYTPSDTDYIWQIVLGSQDPRTAQEVLSLLQRCFEIFGEEQLYYVCQKMVDVPRQRIDLRLLEFGISALGSLRAKGHNSLSQYFNPTPAFDPVSRKLCLRLLRVVGIPSLQPEYWPGLQSDLLDHLEHFLHASGESDRCFAISIEEEEEILSELRADLDAHTEFSAGAMVIMNRMLNMKYLTLNAKSSIIERCGLPKALVEEFTMWSRNDTAIVSMSGMQIEAPLTCLSILLFYTPDNFDDNLVGTLWTTLLTRQSLDARIRLRAWEKIINITKQCKEPNSVIDRILYDHWSQLQPQDFNRAMLDFAEHSISYECEARDQPMPLSGEVVEIPGIDRVWEIMLTAPDGTLETEATDFVINQYLRNNRIKRASRNSVRVTHMALIDKCIELVLGSASKLKSYAEGATNSDGDEGMVIIATPDEIQFEESRFDRSLLFLRRFTEAVRGNPSCSPIASRQPEALPDFPTTRGQLLEFRVQVFGNKYLTDNQKNVSIGSENTGSELWQYLKEISGFENFTVINNGKSRTDFREDNSTIQEMGIMRGALLVKKNADNSEPSDPRLGSDQTSPVDEKIMQHFDDIYTLLESDDRLAKEVYGFLNITAVKSNVSHIARSMTTPASDLLPPEKPYKLLFCVQALRSSVEMDSLSNSPDAQFLAYAVGAITTAIMKLGQKRFDNALQKQIAYELIDTLQLAFRAKVPDDVSKRYLSDHQTFSALVVQYLDAVLSSSSEDFSHQQPEKMTRAAFEVLVEARLQDESAWKNLDASSALSNVLGQALLFDPREKVRQSIVEVLLSLTGVIAPKIHLKLMDGRAFRSRYDSTTIDSCLTEIWGVLLKLLPHTKKYKTLCQEFFDGALAILRKIGKSFELESLRSLFEQWSDAFLLHDNHEIVGQPMRDRFVPGISRIVFECARILRLHDALPPQSKLIRKIMSALLFPPLSHSHQSGVSRIPLLESEVREGLYELLILMCQSVTELDIVVSELSDDLIAPDQFEPHLGHERLALRTEVGYAGLRNLSNTCYLNSLFSQLFMNIQFRQLLLTAKPVDIKQQKLLWEMAKVFAHMQDSYEKSVQPTLAVESIITYDGDNIDVTVQMDVDEFFNLLFDRLEGQILDPNTKTLFKSLYGGQTIQQIKSKECEHVSERPEAFAVLPVEIKGLFGLEESLKAYVEGEMLQGDNKYSCTSCGKFVDAVKRSCLKQVPDNLIFNLKRFDYDIMTGLRCKLNDHFVFPEVLDMAPYTLEHLSQPEKALETDYFELTGIIVHSGTADSGHYFSYIRQRPCAKDKHHSWVQFNDSDVNIFDPAQIQDMCFGGVDATWNNLPKFYNAYMLFYQRRTNIQRIEEQSMHTDQLNPVRLRNPAVIQDYIEKENELFLRSYCAQDPAHARFVRQLVEKLWETCQIRCSEDHDVEDRTLRLALSYLHSVSSRWKGQPEMDTTAKLINKYARHCSQCALTVLQFFAGNLTILSESIVQSPYQATRKAFHNLLHTSVRALRTAIDNEQDSEIEHDYEASLCASINHLRRAWDLVYKSGRSWAEYFGLLSDLVEVGIKECEWVIDAGMLEACFELIHLHHVDGHDFRISDRRLRLQYQYYLTARDRNRPFNHHHLMSFFARMLLRLDLTFWPTSDERLPSTNSDQICPTVAEVEMLGLTVTPPNFDWLKRIIAGRSSPDVANDLVAFLSCDKQLAGGVSNILASGLDHKSMPIAAAFLLPMVVFCSKCESLNRISDLIGKFAESVPTIGLEYGTNYSTAIKKLYQIDNQTLDAEPGFLRDILVDQMHHWAPVLLVAANETGYDVRGEALQMVDLFLLDRMKDLRDEDPVQFRQYQTRAWQLAKHASEYIQSAFLNTNAGENHHLQHGHANRVVQAVTRCIAAAELETAQEEQEAADVHRVVLELKGRADNAVETLSAEWHESSELDAMSDDFEDLTSP